jgi:hypothetical protein
MELLNDHGEERMDKRKDTAVEALMEQLIEHGPGDIAGVFARAFELAMRDASASAFSGLGITSARPSAGAMPTAPSPSGSTRLRAP